MSVCGRLAQSSYLSLSFLTLLRSPSAAQALMQERWFAQRRSSPNLFSHVSRLGSSCQDLVTASFFHCNMPFRNVISAVRDKLQSPSISPAISLPNISAALVFYAMPDFHGVIFGTRTTRTRTTSSLHCIQTSK